MDDNAGCHLPDSISMRSGKQVSRAKPRHKGWAAALLSTTIAIVGLSRTPTASAYNLSMTCYLPTCIEVDPFQKTVYLNDDQGLDRGDCGAHLSVQALVRKLVIASCSE